MNAEMRDRLPDLLHDRLPAPSRAEVEAHLRECADCREELALLGQIRVSAQPRNVDTARIVASLPAYAPPSVRTRAFRSPLLRVAAAVLMMAGGGMLVIDRSPKPAGDVTLGPARIASPGAPSTTGATTTVAARPPAAPQPELAVGALFEDLTDSELRALLESLESLEATTPVETEVVVPAVSRGGA